MVSEEIKVNRKAITGINTITSHPQYQKGKKGHIQNLTNAHDRHVQRLGLPDSYCFASIRFVYNSVISFILLALNCMMRVKSYLALLFRENKYLNGVASSVFAG